MRNRIPPVILAVLLAGCANPVLVFQPYPPDFKYVPHHEIRTAMDRMADEVVHIDRIVRGRQSLNADERATLSELLEELKTQAAGLRGSAAVTNHPMLNAHLDAFLAEVNSARDSVVMEPPNYFLAGSITGACLACHNGGR